MLKDQLPNQNNLLGFVPAIVVDNLMEKIRRKEIRKIPERQIFNSVVMFADISGFTNLSEKLALKGFEGAELLAFALTRYMEFLVKSIGKSGGDIFKFAGDAMIIIWPPPKENSDEELTTLCRRAIQSSLDIQSKLHEIKLVEDIKLSVKIGFGVGQVTILHVGGVFSRAEYLAAGDPLKEAFDCEHLAPGGGYIIISENVYKRVMNYFEFEPIEGHGHGHGEKFYYITKAKKNQMVKMKADALLLNNRIKPSDIEAIRPSLISYIPAAVLPFIEIDEEKWSHELRRLSIMFCNLGIDLSDAQSIKGLDRIQQVIETVQRCVYKHQGSLNKLLMDDKGSTLMIIFGLYPMAHQDDPVRAVLSGIQLIRDLKRINCSCSVGIATGVVFAGVVGTSGSRREFSVLGDKVNLSARFMQAACKEKEKKIFVDETTKTLAENKIAFRFVMNQPVKGKSGEIPFFQPIDPEEDPEVSTFPYNIRTHMFTPQKTGGIIPPESFDMVGRHREEGLRNAVGVIDKFLKRPDHNVLILVTGSYGIGKSLFIRNLLDKIYKISEPMIWKHHEGCFIQVATLNSSTKALPFNGWRLISQQLLISLALRHKTVAESILFKILENEPELLNNLYLTSEILNIKIPVPKKEASSMENIRFQDKELKIVKKILLRIFASFIEEQSGMEESKNSINSGTNTYTPKNNNNNNNGNLTVAAPIVAILEDMQDYDAASWSFTKKLLKHLKKIVIVASIRDKYCEIPPSFAKRTLESNPKTRTSGSDSSVKKSHFDVDNLPIEERLENWATELEETCDPSGFLRIELTGLSEEETRLFVRKLLHTNDSAVENHPETPNRQNSGAEFANPNTDMRNNTLKHQITSNDSENSQKMVDRFLAMLNVRTEGKPLDVLQIVGILIKSEFVKIEGKRLVITQRMKRLYDMKQFLTIEPPLSRTSINGEILDRLETHSYLLLKAAAIIGEEFDLQMLMKVNPFQLSISNEKLRRVINYLEKAEIIEILDENEHNVIYRFINPFMREIIYNRMLFSQRRQLHRFVAEAMQANPLQNEANEKTECEKLIYHWCLAENLDSMSLENENSQFSNKAKRSLIVKKISSLLSKNQHSLSVILKSGSLEKKSDHGMSWSSRFLVLNGKDLKYYYSEADFKKNTDFALGVISLKHIFKIFYLDEKETKRKYAFVIYTGSWQKKNKEMGVREFYFAATEYSILETWTTYLEFLRAKAIYDDFVSSFGKISFPLTGNETNMYETASFGTSKSNLSRMTQALENNRTSYKSPTMQRKNTLSTSRKTTLLKGINSKQIMLNTMQEVMASNANQENAKRTKERVLRFIMTGFKLFSSHIIEAANPKAPTVLLGQTTQILRKLPLNIDDVLLLEDPKPVGFRSNLTESQDLTKGSFEMITGQPVDNNSSGGEYMKIDSSQTSSRENYNNNSNSNKRKSMEDSILMPNNGSQTTFENTIVPVEGIKTDRLSIDVGKTKGNLNLEMIKEVEENHSIMTGSFSQTMMQTAADNPLSKNNNQPILRPSHFGQGGTSPHEDFRKKSELIQVNRPNLHRSTLDDLDYDTISNVPYKNDSAKPSAILTRQELDTLQLGNNKGSSTEEMLFQIEEPDPISNEKLPIRTTTISREHLFETNEGRSCDELVTDVVIVSKKAHKKTVCPIEDLNQKMNFTKYEVKNESPMSRKESHKEVNEQFAINRSPEDENVREEKENQRVRTPKVLMRKREKMGRLEEKQKEEDFMDKLACRVFHQEKPRKKGEEQVNPNYSRINFYKKG